MRYILSLVLLSLLSEAHAACKSGDAANAADTAIKQVMQFRPLNTKDDPLFRPLLDPIDGPKDGAKGGIEDRGVFLEDFDAFMFSLLKRTLQKVDRGLGKEKILDYACGVGRQAAIWGIRLNESPSKDVKVDAADPAMTDHEKSWHELALGSFPRFKEKVRFMQAAISDREVLPGFYDVITVRDAFHLFLPQHYLDFFANAKMLISEKGELLIGAIFAISGLSEVINMDALLSIALIECKLGLDEFNFKHTNFALLLLSANENGWIFYKVYFAKDESCPENGGFEFDCSDLRTLQTKIEEVKNKAFIGRIYLSFKQMKPAYDKIGIDTTGDNQ